jgi:hypothetical protein
MSTEISLELQKRYSSADEAFTALERTVGFLLCFFHDFISIFMIYVEYRPEIMQNDTDLLLKIVARAGLRSNASVHSASSISLSDALILGKRDRLKPPLTTRLDSCSTACLLSNDHV